MCIGIGIHDAGEPPGGGGRHKHHNCHTHLERYEGKRQKDQRRKGWIGERQIQHADAHHSAPIKFFVEAFIIENGHGTHAVDRKIQTAVGVHEGFKNIAAHHHEDERHYCKFAQNRSLGAGFSHGVLVPVLLS